ncbi:MAG TPA: alpha/beta hydrolase domain-containing protein [Verrucomicrobiae bacterium]|nr:alpha/beta hydrolase domain-containing protein [Verrucomicrobiae bacterium]
MPRASVASRRPGVAALTLVAALAAATRPIVAAAAVESPTLEGPITGPGKPFIESTTLDLAQVGYEEAEYFISGTASAFTSSAPLTSDGRWTATAGETAAYKTRVLVYRPTSRTKFNGTLVVEWLNVSGGVDASPDWTSAHTELIRDGFAWMGVSAQFVGVEGGVALVPVASFPLKKVDPARYGSLVHPGDSFSYDIFSQAGQAVRHPAGTSPLGDLEVKRLIAAGDSQSAFRLVTYIDAIHSLAKVYDCFLVHSRGSGGGIGAPLSESPQPSIPAPSPELVRTDLRAPVLTFETETDLTFLGFYSARQPDSRRLRVWEVAGTAHADTYGLVTGPGDLGNSPAAAGIVITASPVPGFITCGMPINSGPQHFVLNAAFAALDRWVRTGKPPAAAPRLRVAAGPPPSIMRDARGNALGGIRTPEVDVPIAAFTGEQNGSLICRLLGTTTLFDAATLASLYPSHRAYVARFDRATRKAVRSGFLLKPDATLLKRWAAGSNVGT